MSVNKVMLLGNVGKNPEIKTFDGGSKVANFTLATTKKGYTTKNGNVIPDRTEWHTIVVFNGLADVCERYIKKGSKVFVEGEIRYRSYDDKNGEKRYVTEIMCDSLEICDRPTESPQTSQTPVQTPVQTPTQAPTQAPVQQASQINPFAKPVFDDTPFPPSGLGGEELPF